MKKTNNPMELKKKYDSVAEMVKDLADDLQTADATVQRINQRTVIDLLMAIRTSKNMSQSDVAKKIGCTQSKISKLESSQDLTLNLGDLSAYGNALGLRLSLLISEQDVTIVEKIKANAMEIRTLLMRLVEFSNHSAPSISGGATTAFCETVSDLAECVIRAVEKAKIIPNLRDQKTSADDSFSGFRFIGMEYDDLGRTGSRAEKPTGKEMLV